MIADVRPELVLNGYPLTTRHKGAGAYAARLIHGLRRCAPERRFRVLLPEPMRAAALAEFPEAVLEFVPGRPPLDRALAVDIYWHSRLAWHAVRRHAGAVFHSPIEMWAGVRPARTVVSMFDCIYRHFPRLQGGRVRRWWWRATERFGRGADAVITISRYARRELIGHAGISADRIRVVYPWVDRFRDEAGGAGPAGDVAARYGLPADYVLYLGGYNENKNVERLIAAYAAAARRRRLPPLVLAGAIPPVDPRLAVCDVRGAIAAARLTETQVRLAGPVAVADLPLVVAAARLLVYPSLHEGFGYPPAEAMAMGTPVIVSDGTSLVEVVRAAHCRFDPTSVESIAEKLLAAAADPAAFRCPLPVEFTEAAGIASYLEVIDGVKGGHD